MCDYSLEAYRSRPARADEKYVTHRFYSGSIGFVSPGDCTTAVCLPADAELRLENIPAEVQTQHGVGPAETVTFVRLDQGGYRDAIKFGNGAVLTLQCLGIGVTAAIAEPERRATAPFAFVESV